MASSRSGSGKISGSKGYGTREHKHWILPEEIRGELKEIMGEILAQEELAERLIPDDPVITVGDVVTLTLLEMGIIPDLSIVDYQTQRGSTRNGPNEEADFMERLSKFQQPVINVKNPPGEITCQLFDAVKDGIEDMRQLRIVVEGEEDLASLVCVLLAPDGTNVIYGIPFKGLMLLTVNARIRERVSGILKKMEI